MPIRTSPATVKISDLIPLSGECHAFDIEVRKLTRPYLPITAADYEHLTTGGADYYLTPDGQVVTFGTADGGFALMPLQQRFAANILEINGFPLG